MLLLACYRVAGAVTPPVVSRRSLSPRGQACARWCMVRVLPANKNGPLVASGTKGPRGHSWFHPHFATAPICTNTQVAVALILRPVTGPSARGYCGAPGRVRRFGLGLAGGLRVCGCRGWLSAWVIPRCRRAHATRPARRCQVLHRQHTTPTAGRKDVACHIGGTVGMPASPMRGCSRHSPPALTIKPPSTKSVVPVM
jgi:hypothetical protein